MTQAAKIRVGSVVTHPLFVGPGTVTRIEPDENIGLVYVVFWQAMNRHGFHSDTSLQLITEAQHEMADESPTC